MIRQHGWGLRDLERLSTRSQSEEACSEDEKLRFLPEVKLSCGRDSMKDKLNLGEMKGEDQHG